MESHNAIACLLQTSSAKAAAPHSAIDQYQCQLFLWVLCASWLAGNTSSVYNTMCQGRECEGGFAAAALLIRSAKEELLAER